MKQLIITLITTVLVSLGVVVLGTASQAHAEEVEWSVTIPKGSVDVDFRQHSCTGAGRIDTSAGWYSRGVSFRVYWPQRGDGKRVNQTETSRAGGYTATVHYWQHNPTRVVSGNKVSGYVKVIAIPQLGYHFAEGEHVVWTYKFTPKGC